MKSPVGVASMPPEQDSRDEGTGFETSAELRHGETNPPEEPELYYYPRRPRWGGWIALVVALVVIGLVTYILVRVF